MPEHGGPATQSGVLYQNSIAALFLGRLLDESESPERERVTEVRVEAPTAVDDLVVTYADGHSVYAQVKENVKASSPAWTGIWASFAEQYVAADYQPGRDRLMLISGSPTSTLSELAEICRRACTSVDSPDEWRDRLSGAQRRVLADVLALLPNRLRNDEATLVEFFASIDVETWLPALVERDMSRSCMPASNVGHAALFRLLRDRAASEARHRGAFRAQRLRDSLAEIDDVHLRAPQSLSAIHDSFRYSAAHLRQHKSTLGQTGVHIERSVVGEILEWVNSQPAEASVALLLDSAGSGKSVVLRDVLRGLEDRGTAVLAIKADLQTTGLQSLTDLSTRLGIDGAIERAVTRVASREPVVVIIDQLDALSLSLARDGQALTTALELIGILRTVPGVKLLISCRTFDRHSDPRLKRLEVSKEYSVERFTRDEVHGFLASLSIDSTTLAEGTQELLRTPLHLDLFASLATRARTNTRGLLGVISLQALYGLLWEEVVLKRGSTTSTPQARERVLRQLASQMAAEQQTVLPLERVSIIYGQDDSPAADELVSDGLLVRAHGTWSFLHQTFFDYCFARFFVADRGDLLEKIRSSEQSVFIRPLIVQVLSYVRSSDQSAYLRTLRGLLAATDLRIHVSTLVLRWLGAIPDPTAEEWALVRARLLTHDHAQAMIDAMSRNEAWLPLLTPLLPSLLEREDAFVDSGVVWYLISIVNGAAQRDVVTLVGPWLDRQEPWTVRAIRVVGSIRTWRSEAAVALYERVIRHNPLEHIELMFQLKNVAASDPLAGCRAMRLVLDGIWEAYRSDQARAGSSLRGISEVFARLSTSSFADAVAVLSDRAPQLYVPVALEWLEHIVHTGAVMNGDVELVIKMMEQRDGDWSTFEQDVFATRWESDRAVLGTHFLRTIKDAMVKLARQDSALFATWIERVSRLRTCTFQRLAASVYIELAEARAGEVLDFVLADRRRLRIEANNEFVSRRLVRALAPRLDARSFQRLENYVVGEEARVRRPDWLARADWAWWLRSFGQVRLHLLHCLPFERLSQSAQQLLRELERKFPGVQTPDFEKRVQGGWVSSPIAQDVCARFSIAAWLRAMAHYSGDVKHKDFLRGGAHELARVLEEHIKERPAEFVGLVSLLPDTVETSYIAACIAGFTQAGDSASVVCDLVRRFAPERGLELQRQVAWSLTTLVGEGTELSPDLLEMLSGWIDRPMQSDEEHWEQQNAEPHTAALNSTRGATFRALLLESSRNRSGQGIFRHWELLERGAADPSPALRVSVLEFLPPLLRVDAGRTVTIGLKCVDGATKLAESDEFFEFVYWAMRDHLAAVVPFIESAMRSSKPEAQRRAAELAVLARLVLATGDSSALVGRVATLVADAFEGTVEQRQGVARICARNWAIDATGECAQGLTRLWNDEDRDVRQEIAHLVSEAKPIHVLEQCQLLLDFASSASAEFASLEFSEFLFDNGSLDYGWSMHVIRSLVDGPSFRISRPYVAGLDDLIRVVLRCATDGSQPESLRGSAMDVFDLIVQRFDQQAAGALSEWDRH